MRLNLGFILLYIASHLAPQVAFETQDAKFQSHDNKIAKKTDRSVH